MPTVARRRNHPARHIALELVAEAARAADTEGLSVVSVNGPKMKQWLKAFPGALNDTGDLPVIKRGKGHFG
ncbi:hypothetical protein FYL58_25880 [Klebsiella aerogenes]|nr:hypothetical protein [Klebsiella aerogenes]EIW9500938.1 hypothetical protein [Klebsiella aerogenes]EKM7515390.1 hypothetical protein [Klebsiella aerogenes]HDT6627380.1 hypothetical protein [Klebsiella aerogenes]HEJ0418119.1 hypothetical protein [Klebsiella aerogenes]